jgi:hypothetical protein
LESEHVVDYGLCAIAHNALFLLCKVQDYAKYAAPGWQYLFDMQAVSKNPTLNLLAIMLLSFRVSHEGEQHGVSGATVTVRRRIAPPPAAATILVTVSPGFVAFGDAVTPAMRGGKHTGCSSVV